MNEWLKENGLDLTNAIMVLIIIITFVSLFIFSFPASKHEEVITYQSVYAIDGNMAILKDENGNKHTVQFDKIFYLQEEEPPFIIVKYNKSVFNKRVLQGFNVTYLFIYQPKTTITI